MSNNGDESSDSYPSVSEDSSDDGYSDEDIEYRHYVNPLMRYIPEAMRSEVRKMCKDTARVYGKRDAVRRISLHYKVVNDKTETCMQEGCNKLTNGKCARCHVFLCTDSKSDCFEKFHDID
eukprot:XP_016661364.1 PREDICTED: uncharacterized protein LOC107884226 isoform X1 [Acyrthosiphon pisum]